jgi:hypothetical protein
MNKYILLVLGILLVYRPVNAQKLDFNWINGVKLAQQDSITNFLINFNHYPPSIDFLNTDIFFTGTEHSISDNDGNLLFYSNGCSLWEHGDTSILISDSLSAESYSCENGNAFRHPQTLFSLPIGQNKYLILGASDQLVSNCGIPYYYYLVIDFSNPPAKITTEKTILTEGCIRFLSCSRHANGRDWWVIAAENETKEFRRWLITPDSMYGPNIQQYDFEFEDGLWWDFTPDGNTMLIRGYKDGYILLLDFDRCTGLFSNPVKIIMSPYGSFTAVFSPDGRFIYTSDMHFKELVQFDRMSPDIAASKKTVAYYDGFIDPKIINAQTLFGSFQRGPNGKIYIYAGDTHYMHVINFPNRLGDSCNPVLRAITFPQFTFRGYTSYANYRLGPIDGSVCDSLGIDNIPMAMYHYDIEDTLSPLAVTFTDASYYEPTSWHWSFGDGNPSTAISPIHTFAGPGSYTVCLIVSNQYGADTLCRDIQVDDISNIVNLPIIPQAKISPNPFNDELHIQLPALLNGIQSQFRLIDMFGREILLTTLTDFDNTILVGTIPSGLYIWQMSWNGKVYQVGKMVKM